MTKQHFPVAEIANEWNFSRNTITRLFQKEPGVLRFSNEGKRHKRIKTTLRIPAGVKERVYSRMQVR